MELLPAAQRAPRSATAPFCEEGDRQLGDWRHPEISLHTHSLGDYMDFINVDDWQGVAGLMLSSANKLAKAGAEFLICPDNTIHRAFETVAPKSPLPWLHIVEEVAVEAKRRDFTSWQLQARATPWKARSTHRNCRNWGIEFMTPNQEERRCNR